MNNENPHINNIGKLVEDSEIMMRESLDSIYFAKTKEIKDTLRSIYIHQMLLYSFFDEERPNWNHRARQETQDVQPN